MASLLKRLALASLVLVAGTTQAATTRYWTGLGGDGNWNTAANWSGTTVPISGTVADIGTTTSGGVSTGTSTINNGVTDPSTGSLNNLILGDGSTDHGTLNVGNGTTGTATLNAGTASIGNSGTGTLNVNNGGAVTFSGALHLGQNSTGTGTINLYPGGSITLSSFSAGMALGYSLGTSTGTINQSGGTFTDQATLLLRAGAYSLTGGTLTTLSPTVSAHSETIADVNTATFTQNGSGTSNSFSGGMNIGYEGGTGTYNLLSGTLKAVNTGVALANVDVGATEYTAGGHSSGTFYMGNAAGTGIISGSVGSGSGNANTSVGMLIRHDAAGSGTFEGYGTVGLKGYLTNNGVVRANGYGTDGNVLDMSSFTNYFPNSNVGGVQYDDLHSTIITTQFNNTGGQGWFATNHGELLLPSLAVSTTPNTYYWGGSTYINSVALTYGGTITAGSVTIDLLAKDRGDVYAGLIDPIGIWSVSSSGVSYGSMDAAFRYDDGAAASLTSLNLFHWDGVQWDLVSTTLDPVNDTLTTGNLASFSGEYAIAQSVVAVPEPSTLALFVTGALGLLAYAWRRVRNVVAFPSLAQIANGGISGNAIVDDRPLDHVCIRSV